MNERLLAVVLLALVAAGFSGGLLLALIRRPGASVGSKVAARWLLLVGALSAFVFLGIGALNTATDKRAAPEETAPWLVLVAVGIGTGWVRWRGGFLPQSGSRPPSPSATGARTGRGGEAREAVGAREGVEPPAAPARAAGPPDVFLSYASSDRDRAARVARALEVGGWSVWWDRKIAPGRAFDRVIAEALDSSRCVVVLWSRASVESDWVREEAAEGQERDVMVPALLDDVRIPLGFRRLQAARLVDWDGEPAHPAFQPLLDAVGDVVAASDRGSG
jgi:hypothetical protein